MRAETNLTDLRCIRCGTGRISVVDESGVCDTCHTEHQHVYGVLFLGGYEHGDVLSLVEIAANRRNRGRFGVTVDNVAEWERRLREHHSRPRTSEAESKEGHEPYFANRYAEWVELEMLLADINLDGRKVLDIGAGLGFDSQRLASRGASVTALEISPILAESGSANFPHMRWIGGLSHCLPFVDESFDAVFCNAALHHMRDIPATIREALRVLRPDGVLITTCDSFRPDNQGEEYELRVMNQEPSVLLGVNERVPRFSEYVRTLQQFRSEIDIELRTHGLYSADGLRCDTTFQLWNFDRDARTLSSRAGTIAMKVRKRRSIPIAAGVQVAEALSAKAFAAMLDGPLEPVGQLAQMIPSEFVDMPLIPTTNKKFELLNGWRISAPMDCLRVAYGRGRWFLSRPEGATRLLFRTRVPRTADGGPAEIAILLNGSVVDTRKCPCGVWMEHRVDVSDFAPGERFSLEIALLNAGDSIEDGSVQVQCRQFMAANAPEGGLSEGTDRRPCVHVVIPVFNRIEFTRSCIRSLSAQSYSNLQIVVSDGGSTDGTVSSIRSEFPGVTVLATDQELWWAGSMAKGIEHVMNQGAADTDFVLMMNNDTLVPDDYVETLVGASIRCNAAVGAKVVDSRDESRVLDAGEYIDWHSYLFPVKNQIDEGVAYCDNVDVLPGRGTLVPLFMIRRAGNVDHVAFPHYLADYEFFTRLKRHGFSLGVCYETSVIAHIEETGIKPGTARAGIRELWREAFSRRSMSNVVDHWRFISRHAPANRRLRLQVGLIWRVIRNLLFRSWLAPVANVIRAVVVGAVAQCRMGIAFLRLSRQIGIDVVCHPQAVPGVARWAFLLLMSPGPFRKTDAQAVGLDPDAMLARGEIRALDSAGWFALNSVKNTEDGQAERHRKLVWRAWNPARKVPNLVAIKRARIASHT